MTSFRIAICDDHPVFRAGLGRFLERELPCEIALEAPSAAELLAGLDAARVDLLILDMELADGDGLDVLAKLQSTSSTPRPASQGLTRCPVLVLSAFDEPARVHRALRLGATAYVRKDADMPMLLSAVRSALLGKTFVDPRLANQLARAIAHPPELATLRSKVERLSPRHREVLGLVAQGKSSKEIAQTLFISPGTSKNHITRICKLLGVRDRAELVLVGARLNLGEAPAHDHEHSIGEDSHH